MRDNVSEPLDRACAGRVLPERNVSSHFIIIGGIFRKNSSKVMFADYDHLISALAPDLFALVDGCSKNKSTCRDADLRTTFVLN